MPLKSYGVLKGRVVARKVEQNDSSPHFQVHVKAAQKDYRIAINVKSVQAPFDLLYYVDDNFKHPISDRLTKLKDGFNEIKASERKAGGIALDYIRANLFDVKNMKPLPYNKPGADNDLNDLIDLYIRGRSLVRTQTFTPLEKVGVRKINLIKFSASSLAMVFMTFT
jgi:uncharacterized protein YukJ